MAPSPGHHSELSSVPDPSCPVSLSRQAGSMGTEKQWRGRRRMKAALRRGRLALEGGDRAHQPTGDALGAYHRALVGPSTKKAQLPHPPFD